MDQKELHLLKTGGVRGRNHESQVAPLAQFTPVPAQESDAAQSTSPRCLKGSQQAAWPTLGADSQQHIARLAQDFDLACEEFFGIRIVSPARRKNGIGVQRHNRETLPDVRLEPAE